LCALHRMWDQAGTKKKYIVCTPIYIYIFFFYVFVVSSWRSLLYMVYSLVYGVLSMIHMVFPLSHTYICIYNIQVDSLAGVEINSLLVA